MSIFYIKNKPIIASVVPDTKLIADDSEGIPTLETSVER